LVEYTSGQCYISPFGTGGMLEECASLGLSVWVGEKGHGVLWSRQKGYRGRIDFPARRRHKMTPIRPWEWVFWSWIMLLSPKGWIASELQRFNCFSNPRGGIVVAIGIWKSLVPGGPGSERRIASSRSGFAYSWWSKVCTLFGIRRCLRYISRWLCYLGVRHSVRTKGWGTERVWGRAGGGTRRRWFQGRLSIRLFLALSWYVLYRLRRWKGGCRLRRFCFRGLPKQRSWECCCGVWVLL
jgi:hypothetical protein